MFEIRRRRATDVVQEDIDLVQELAEDPLARTGRFCGGLFKDVKRRLPHYVSDFTDAFDFHCLAAIFFVYMALLAPAITFGGILSKKTEGWIGVSETVMANALGGILFALLAGQPLIIISFTGPLEVFERSTYDLSGSLGVEYLPFRAWIGIWVMLICFLLVAFEGCFLVRYFTRFTEEIFACLIAFTFIYDAVNIVVDEFVTTSNVTCFPPNSTSPSSSSSHSTASGHLAILLVIGTFLISCTFRSFRHSLFLGHLARRVISDLGVPIAIIAMAVYYSLDDDVPVSLLSLPDGFERTRPDRESWFVNLMGSDDSINVGYIIGAIVPALLVSILIFMEVELTGVIFDKKEFKLKKGPGYNLDLLVAGIVVGLCSLLGFPWMCASPIHSVSHLQALMIFNHKHAPGKRPELLEVKEQRVTSVIIHALIGLSTFKSPILQAIPIAVLAGVLLYLGLSSLSHVQLCERVKLLFQPSRNHPDVPYVLHVKTNRMHIFTLIQVVCVCIVIFVKLTPIAETFPFFVLCLVPLRKFLAQWFDEEELNVLDNDEEKLNDEECDEYDGVHVPI